MSIRKTNISILVAAILACPFSAGAGLYGFTEINPYTPEEKILDIDVPPKQVTNFRETLRHNVEMLSNYAYLRDKNFQIIIHEGQELLNKSLWEYHLTGYNEARARPTQAKDPSFLFKFKKHRYGTNDVIGTPPPEYLTNITGIVLNKPYSLNRIISPGLLASKLKIIAFDLCTAPETCMDYIKKSVADNILLQTGSSATTIFRNIEEQPVINENARNIFKLSEAENNLYLNDESSFRDKYDLIKQLRNTNFDVVIIRPQFNNKEAYTTDEVNSLKFKKNGTRRLIFAEMNLTEANPEQYYWKKKWQLGKPSWLRRKSFSNQGSIIAEYWNDEWRKIIGNHFKSIIDTKYDGAFFTGLENHKYFEYQLPLE